MEVASPQLGQRGGRDGQSPPSRLTVRPGAAIAVACSGAWTGEVKLPFSFGLEQGMAESAIVVIKGYTSFAANAQPVIEQKVAAKFAPGKTLELTVMLTEAVRVSWRSGRCLTRCRVRRSRPATMSIRSPARRSTG
jgi:hypothetical protein